MRVVILEPAFLKGRSALTPRGRSGKATAAERGPIYYLPKNWAVRTQHRVRKDKDREGRGKGAVRLMQLLV